MPTKAPLFSNRFFVAYLAILVWTPLPYASYYGWSSNLMNLLIMGLAAVMVLSLLLGNRDFIAPLKHHWFPVGVFFLVPLWITLQTIPMSPEFITSLSPVGAEIQRVAGLELYTISLEPNATRQEALLSWSLWLFFVMTLLLVDSGKRARVLITTVVFCGVFQALYGSFVVLTDIDYLFFSGQDNNPGSATGTFMIRNHFAGYLEMCLALGIGLLVGTLSSSRNDRSWRDFFVDSIDTLLGPKMRLRLFLAIMVIALVMSRSRMGNSAFFLSLPLCGVLFMILQRKIHKGAIILFTSLILVDVLIVSQWFGLDQVAERMQSTSTETEMRDEVIRDTLTMLPDYQLFGSGAGTYLQTFQRYDDVRAARMVDFAVNDYLEFLVEFGWVGYVPLAILVLYSLFKAASAMAKRRTQLFRGIGFGAMMGTVSILIHSFVDFNLQMPANALLFVLLLALALLSKSLERGGGARRKRTSHTEAGYSQ